MKLLGKAALITGASRGIGKAIALEFAQQGIKQLLLVSRSQNSLEQLKTEIQELDPEVVVTPIPLDLTETSRIKQIIPQHLSVDGPIHILVNNAGVAHQASFLSSNLEDFEDEINLNLRGTFAITRILAQHMAQQREGTIVNVSSLMGKLAAPTYSTYSATKFALLGLTQSLRMELTNHNVQVVALLPTLTETDMVHNTTKFGLVIPSSPGTVAKVLVQGLRHGKHEILVGWQSKLAVLASYIMPWFVEWIINLAATYRWQSTLPKRADIEFKDCCSHVTQSSC